jgi:hypothetical protein
VNLSCPPTSTLGGPVMRDRLWFFDRPVQDTKDGRTTAITNILTPSAANCGGTRAREHIRCRATIVLARTSLRPITDKRVESPT